jgi:hypothetical protein
MGQHRLRGDQCLIRLVQSATGVAETTWNAVATIDVTSKNSILEEEFLGESSKRYDAIFEGFGMSCEVQMFGKDEQDLEDAINAKNARRGAAAAQRFDISLTTSYPSGQVTTRVLEDVEFGEIKTSVGGRAEFVKMSFEGACSSASRFDG